MFVFFSPTDCQTYKALVWTPLHNSVPPLEGLTGVSSKLVTYCRSLAHSWVFLSLSRHNNLLWRYTHIAFGFPLGGCMDIQSIMASSNIFLSFTRINCSKSTIITEPCLLICPDLYLYARSCGINLHTVSGPWISEQLTFLLLSEQIWSQMFSKSGLYL